MCTTSNKTKWMETKNSEIRLKAIHHMLDKYVANVNFLPHFEVWKHNTNKNLFHELIHRHCLFIQFTEVTRGGHPTHDHIWEEPSLRLCKQTTHVDNPKIVENKNSFLISCSVWSFTVMLCTEDIFSCLKQYVKAACVSDYSWSIPSKLGMLSWFLWLGG